MEEGGIGGGMEEGVVGEAREKVKLQVVGGLGVAVAVEQGHQQQLRQPQPEGLSGGSRTRSRLSLRRPIVEKARRFSSYRT